MTISLEDPPAKWRYNVLIIYDGVFEQEKKNYSGGKWIRVRDLDCSEKSKEDCLSVVTDLAHGLGYYRDTLLQITSQEQVMKLLSQQKFSREVTVYLDGRREKKAQEQNPTILSWNCRGLYRPSARAMLRVLNLIHDPTIMILIETRMESSEIKKLAHSMGFPESRAASSRISVPPLKDFTVDTNGSQDKDQEDSKNCVGLAVLWKTNIELDHLVTTRNYIQFEVKDRDANKIWSFTALYGHPKDKKQTREWLKMIKSSNQISRWLVVGDLNSICNLLEKSGGSTSKETSAEISKFAECLKQCDLSSLPFEGIEYTWTGSGEIRERLDRGVASSTWMNSFDNSKTQHLTDQTISDHVPILVKTDSSTHKPLKTKSLLEKMENNFLKFIHEVQSLYSENIRTVSRMRSESRMRSQTSRSNSDEKEKQESLIKDYFFDIAQNVGPHIFQVKYIAMHRMQDDIRPKKKKTHNNEKMVTYEQLVTLATRHDLRALLLNCMANPEPSREHVQELDIQEEFPSLSSKTSEIIEEFNLSDYLVQTWKLVKLISTDRKVSVKDIVNVKKDEQVENLMRWYGQIEKNIGRGQLASPTLFFWDNSSPIPFDVIIESLSKEAIKKGRAVIMCRTMISLIRRKIIEPHYTSVEVTKIVDDEYNVYEFTLLQGSTSSPRIDEFSKDHQSDCQETVEHVLDVSQCRDSIITEELLIKRLDDLEKGMVQVERDIMLAIKLEHWIELIVEHGSLEKEKLAEKVDTSTIERQIALLQQIGCISISNNKEIEFGVDKNPESIVNRLEKAADEAFKILKGKSTKMKSMTFSAYIRKLKDTYKCTM